MPLYTGNSSSAITERPRCRVG